MAFRFSTSRGGYSPSRTDQASVSSPAGGGGAVHVRYPADGSVDRGLTEARAERDKRADLNEEPDRIRMRKRAAINRKTEGGRVDSIVFII